MGLIALLLIAEALNFLVMKERFKGSGPYQKVVTIFINLVLSSWLWYTVIHSVSWKGPFDDPQNIWMRMNMGGMITAVLFPRIVIILLHYTGKIIRYRSGGYNRSLTDSGIVFASVFAIIILFSTFTGRFNFRVETVDIRVKATAGLVDPVKIVQVSDLHLSTYRLRLKKLEKAVEIMNSLDPDIVINTGDFISFGWREFGRFDTILIKEKNRYGKYAVLGNHDLGTYLPRPTTTDRSEVVENVKKSITLSGYEVLDNTSIITDVNGAKIAITGVTTGGRYPDIIHADVTAALAGTDDADIRILLAHDPNQWQDDIRGKTGVELTLSGHTHGMQMGIITKRFRWSPASFFYPHWNGLYKEGSQYHYVNRGLGVLSVPFRVWMPPEITLINIIPE